MIEAKPPLTPEAATQSAKPASLRQVRERSFWQNTPAARDLSAIEAMCFIYEDKHEPRHPNSPFIPCLAE